MWLHRRTGRSSGVSVSSGALLLTVLTIGTMIVKAWPVAIGLLVIYGGYAWLQRNPHQIDREAPVNKPAVRRMDQVRARGLGNINVLSRKFHQRMSSD